MDSHDRDRDRNARKEQAIERLLPAALAGDTAATGADAAACPDAEILAAFYERSLQPAEVTHWRAHFAACRRCQLALAALAASDPRPLAEKEVERLGELVAEASAPRAPGDSPARPKPQKIKLPWFLDPRALAPMAAAAAFVVAVGLTIRTRHNAPLLESQMQNAPQQVIVAENRSESVAPALQTSAPKPEESRAKASPELKQPPQSPAPSPSAVIPRYSSGVAAQREEMRADSEPPAAETSSRPAPAAAPSPPPPPAPGEATNRTAAESGPASGEITGPAGGSAAAPPASAPAEDRSASTNAPASGAAAPAAPASAPAEDRTAASHVRREKGVLYQKNYEPPAGIVDERVTAANAPEYFVATAPDSQTQWRFGFGGLIERTTNAGAAAADQSWTRQKSPLRLDLLAGSAPSATVCWIVGRAGAILRTTDGAIWQVIPSPESAVRDGAPPDWVGVSARDANSATITSADGRIFSTTDAGQTWQPR